MSSPLDDHKRRVLAAVSIVDVIAPHVELRRHGTRHLGLCPFHSEKTPSFSVNPDAGMYYCFGCKASGDHIKFLREVEGLDFMEALRRLSEMARIPMPALERDSPDQRARRAARATREERLLQLHEEAALWFRRHLERGGEGRDYAARRALAEETTAAWSLGFAPAGWSNFLDHAVRAGFEPDLVVESGLAVRREPEGGGSVRTYDRFRRRLVFPIRDHRGRVVGFGGRAIVPEDEPKYLNSPESPIYHKGEVLYGLHEARRTIREKGYAVILEGYMDVISLWQAGFQNAVATCGTALTPQQAGLLRRSCDRVVFVYDGDAAGQTAMRRGALPLLGAGLHVRVVALPPEHDPDSLVREVGAAAFASRLAAAEEVFDYFLAIERGRHGVRTSEGRVRLVEAMAELLAAMPHDVAQQRGLDLLADATSTDRRTVQRLVRAVMERLAQRAQGREAAAGAAGGAGGEGGEGRPDHAREGEGEDAPHPALRAAPPEEPEIPDIERGLLRLMVEHPPLRDHLGETIPIEWITSPFVRHCLERLAAAGETAAGDAIALLCEHVARSGPEHEVLVSLLHWRAADFAGDGATLFAGLERRLRMLHHRGRRHHHARAVEQHERRTADAFFVPAVPETSSAPETGHGEALGAWWSLRDATDQHVAAMREVYPWLPRARGAAAHGATGAEDAADADWGWEDRPAGRSPAPAEAAAMPRASAGAGAPPPPSPDEAEEPSPWEGAAFDGGDPDPEPDPFLGPEGR